MKQMSFAVAIALGLGVSAISAASQVASAPAQQAAGERKDVTITGCVVKGDGGYVLTNVGTLCAGSQDLLARCRQSRVELCEVVRDLGPMAVMAAMAPTVMTPTSRPYSDQVLPLVIPHQRNQKLLHVCLLRKRGRPPLVKR